MKEREMKRLFLKQNETTELEHNQGKKRQFHLRVSLMDRTVQKRVGTGDKEDKTHLLLLKTA